MDPELCRQLVEMAEEDRSARERLAAEGSLFDGYHPEMQAIHDRNADRRAEIIDRHGWPGRSLAGEDGSRAAWLILQHAINRPEFLRRGLSLLRDASVRGEASDIELAMLDDRIRFFEGRPQRFGTQYDWDEHGRLTPHAIEDVEHVDDRRAAIGLPPLDENTRRMREAAARDGEGRPKDLEARRRAFLAWSKSVGWKP